MEQFDDNESISLCEALDRILNKGAVIKGEVMISVADVDLVYLDLKVMLASVETARNLLYDRLPNKKGFFLRAGAGAEAEMKRVRPNKKEGLFVKDLNHEP